MTEARAGLFAGLLVGDVDALLGSPTRVRASLVLRGRLRGGWLSGGSERVVGLGQAGLRRSSTSRLHTCS